jgi:hypothetical protein
MDVQLRRIGSTLQCARLARRHTTDIVVRASDDGLASTQQAQLA